MPIPQQPISLRRFGEEMRRDDPGFAERVARFEARFGPVDARQLAVLAQASYFCWFEQEYARDFAEVCRAIGAGHPTSLYLCHQVTPARWIELHAYVVGVQHWLGVAWPLPAVISQDKITRITGWLGPRTPRKESLARLYLRWLCERLARYPLSILTGEEAREHAQYEDFSAWYRIDGVAYAGGADAVVDDLVAHLMRESQPGCMHRFTRYQDIKIASIGAGRWRGNLPAETDAPKETAARYFDQAVAAVQDWCRGEACADAIGAALHALLGPYSAVKAAINTDFLLKPKDDLNTTFFDWIRQASLPVR